MDLPDQIISALVPGVELGIFPPKYCHMWATFGSTDLRSIHAPGTPYWAMHVNSPTVSGKPMDSVPRGFWREHFRESVPHCTGSFCGPEFTKRHQRTCILMQWLLIVVKLVVNMFIDKLPRSCTLRWKKSETNKPMIRLVFFFNNLTGSDSKHLVWVL